MDKSAKKEALEMTEHIMKLSLYYCKDDDDEIAAYSIRVNSEARKLQKLIERYLTDQIHN
tara:strand:+ start:6675 stop:6854 length:180 start_codon:yes stop_codon:yes gene_type:complete